MKHIKTFQNFELNEGIFTGEYDDVVKDLFEKIQKTFNSDNLDTTPRWYDEDEYDENDLTYKHCNISLRVCMSNLIYNFSPVIYVDDEEVNCSTILSFKIGNFLSKKYKEKKNKENKEKEIKRKQDIERKIKEG